MNKSCECLGALVLGDKGRLGELTLGGKDDRAHSTGAAEGTCLEQRGKTALRDSTRKYPYHLRSHGRSGELSRYRTSHFSHRPSHLEALP